MKANAPEKLYVNFHFIETHPESHQPLVTKQGINKYDIEYIRADAFMEKAYEYLSYHLDTSKIDVNYKFDFIEEFRKYMEGE